MPDAKAPVKPVPVVPAATATPKLPVPTEEALKHFVDEVVALTKSEREGVQKFAKEYLPIYAEYLAESKSADPDVKTRGIRMVCHIRAQVALRASTYGVKLEQSMLEALFGIFNAAIDKII